MRPPRVLMTADTVGGVWTYALDLAHGLTRAGVETVLVTLGPAPNADQRRAAAEIAGLSLIETDLTLDWMAACPGEIGRAGAEIRRLARATPVDLVHLNTPALAVGGDFDAPVIGACHSCLATWWSTVRGDCPPADFRWRIEAHRRGMEACRSIVAPSASFAAATAGAYGIAPPIVVHNGRESPAASRTRADEALVFTAGRLWDEGKNMATLDAAAALSGFPVFAAGSLTGPLDGDGLALHHARPLGRLAPEAVAGWLARAPIFASSALYEPFGLGVLEAAQAGCALVLSAIPTFRELWNGAAVFVDPADPAAFAQAFEALFANDDLRARLGRLARARAARFSVREMTAGTLAVYAAAGLAGYDPAAVGVAA